MMKRPGLMKAALMAAIAGLMKVLPDDGPANLRPGDFDRIMTKSKGHGFGKQPKRSLRHNMSPSKYWPPFKGTVVKNPKIAEHMNLMHNAWHSKKFSQPQT